jgi:hypothetical protein
MRGRRQVLPHSVVIDVDNGIAIAAVSEDDQPEEGAT